LPGKLECEAGAVDIGHEHRLHKVLSVMYAYLSR
jgi:hypothetical protein